MIFFVFVFGLIVGSFLNAIIFRLKTGETFVFSRSHCLHCKHALAPWDLIPVLSFVLLRGRCRYCGKQISWQYPIIELATAASLVLLAQNFQNPISDFQFWFQAVFISFLIVIAAYDYRHYLILDKVVFPGAVIALGYNIFTGHFLSGVAAAAVIAGFFLLQYWYSKGKWIGFGDVKLGLFLGLISSTVSLGMVLMMLAYFVGAAVGIVLLIQGKKHLSSKLPFGVFLGISGIITLVYGEKILNWYLKLIGV